MKLALKVIPPVQLVISSGLMYVVAINLPQYSFDFTKKIIMILALITVASLLGILALYDFHKHQTTFHPHTPEKTRTVVDSGVFAYSRNPMYLALVMTLFAFGIYLENYSCFVIMPLFIWYITRFQIIPEEQMLDKLFPHDYQAYCKRVRRWF